MRIVDSKMLAVLLLAAAAACASAADVYYVRMGPFPSASEADKFQEGLASAGWMHAQRGSAKAGKSAAPAAGQAEESVYCGPYRYYPEAEFVMNELADKHKGAALVTRIGPGSKDAVQSSKGLPARIFQLRFRSSDLAPDAAFDEKQPAALEIYRMINKGQLPEAKAKLAAIAETMPDGNPLKGWATLRSGYLAVRENRFDDAVKCLEPCASGKFDLPRGEQTKAMLTLCRMYKRMGMRAQAFKAFDEMEEYVHDPALKATARVEKCALLFEYARCAKGQFATLRQAFSEALAQTPSSCKTQRGTIELMNLESYYYEKDYTRTTELGQQWLKEYADQTRDRAMCCQFVGLAFATLGDDEKSEEVLASVLDQPEPKSLDEQFGTHGKPWDMKVRTLETLVHLAQKRGDAQKEQFWSQALQQVRESKELPK